MGTIMTCTWQILVRVSVVCCMLCVVRVHVREYDRACTRTTGLSTRGEGMAHAWPLPAAPFGRSPAPHLARVEPQRPLGSKVLRQDGKHALHAAQDGAVHDDGPLARAVLGHVLEPEPDGQLEVQLHGGALELAPQGVVHGDVDLGAVERAVPCVGPPGVPVCMQAGPTGSRHCPSFSEGPTPHRMPKAGAPRWCFRNTHGEGSLRMRTAAGA